MGHATREDLLDLADVLGELRKLPGITERSHGIFYVKRTPFLHFHTKDGNRWADVRLGQDWGPKIPIAFESGARARQQFLKRVLERYKSQVARTAPLKRA
jgi:hypothetical protein